MSTRYDHRIAIVGPTASGKSALAMALARRRRDIELVSVDSMAVYRGMDIGTSKPAPADRAKVRHHLIDLVEPTEEFSVSCFKQRAKEALEEIGGRGHVPLFVGGTGLYLRAAVDDLEIPGRWPGVAAQLESEADRPGGVERLHARLAAADPLAAARIAPGNRRRVVRALEVVRGSGRAFSSFGPGLAAHPPGPFRIVGLDLPQATLHRRIERRWRSQLESGLLDEVRRLSLLPLSRTARQAIGYSELLEHLSGKMSLAEASDGALRRTRRLARRQLAWFRRDPRVAWLRVGSGPDEEAAPPEVGKDLAALDSLLGDWPECRR